MVARLSFKDTVPSENDRNPFALLFSRHFKQKALTLPTELGSRFSMLLELSDPITIRFPSRFLGSLLAWH